MEKRFLTPSGQLLYREQQVDSLLDTKRLKLSPSNAERPVSPLAVYRTDEDGTNTKKLEYECDDKRDGIASHSESDGNHEEQDSSPFVGKDEGRLFQPGVSGKKTSSKFSFK